MYNNSRKTKKRLIEELRESQELNKKLEILFLESESMREKLDECNKDTKAALEKGQEELELFVASVVHDMRNPVIAIGISAKSLLKEREKPLESEAANALLSLILSNTESLERLIGDIITCIQTRKAPLNPTRFKTKELFADLLKQFYPKLASKKVHVELPKRSFSFFGDKARLVEALGNLIDNALKYGGEGFDLIRLGHSSNVKFHVLSVYNNGSSIEDLEGIFQPFRRSGQKSSRRIGGFGLGLFSVRGIAERHRGRAWAASTGRGVTFFLSVSKDL